MEQWKYDYSSLPRGSREFYDPGIDKEEAEEVYQVMDQVFAKVFPHCSGLSRQEAAEQIQALLRTAYDELKCGKFGASTHTQSLISFMKELKESLESTPS
ncbi:MAG: hypothetical protein RIQ41_364 [Candidatus Parcubacteria bacterium]